MGASLGMGAIGEAADWHVVMGVKAEWHSDAVRTSRADCACDVVMLLLLLLLYSRYRSEKVLEP